MDLCPIVNITFLFIFLASSTSFLAMFLSSGIGRSSLEILAYDAERVSGVNFERVFNAPKSFPYSSLIFASSSA